MRHEIRFLRRERLVAVDAKHARMTLLDWLRLDEHCVGTKEGCAEGDCGACTVVLARVKNSRVMHQPVNACILLLGQVDGAQVITVEDLAAPDGRLHPVQEAMVRHHGSQCGFCTPGIVMSLFAQHEGGPRPLTRPVVCDQLAGNLCRCTGYRPIIDAAMEAATLPPVKSRGAAGPEALAALDDEADILAVDADACAEGNAAFFAAPRSEAALVGLLARCPDVQIVAGTTDVGVTITKAMAQPRQIVWLGRVRGLDQIGVGDGRLSIGAAVTLNDAAADLAKLAPDLGEVVRRFGSVQVRSCATVGGNIANGSPIGDLAPCLIALGATLELAGPQGSRTLPLERFFIAYKHQDRRPGEYVRRIIVPLPPDNHVFRAYKISKRRDEDISAVLGAFAFVLEGRRIASARLAFGGMAATPRRAAKTELQARGIGLDDRGTWQAALAALEQEFTPMSDHRASAGYRRIVARNLLEKALIELAGAPAGTTRIEPAAEAGHVAG